MEAIPSAVTMMDQITEKFQVILVFMEVLIQKMPYHMEITTITIFQLLRKHIFKTLETMETIGKVNFLEVAKRKKIHMSQLIMVQRIRLNLETLLKQYFLDFLISERNSQLNSELLVNQLGFKKNKGKSHFFTIKNITMRCRIWIAITQMVILIEISKSRKIMACRLRKRIFLLKKLKQMKKTIFSMHKLSANKSSIPIIYVSIPLSIPSSIKGRKVRIAYCLTKSSWKRKTSHQEEHQRK